MFPPPKRMPVLTVGPADAPRIAVASGGPSPEASYSRSSAESVYAALSANGYEVVWLDLRRDDQWDVLESVRCGPRAVSGCDLDVAGGWRETLAGLLRVWSIELVFPVMHGAVGEDGQIQTLCESLALPYVGSGPDASLLCFDKVAFKRRVSAEGLPIARFLAIERGEYLDDAALARTRIAEHVGYPCIVKPARGGSSFGLSRAGSAETLDIAISGALRYDDVVVIEHIFAGIDVEIGILDRSAAIAGSPVEIEFDGPLYDFVTKSRGTDRMIIPARISRSLTRSVTDLAAQAFRVTQCRGLARVDVLVDSATETYVLNEINTIPYMPNPSSFSESLVQATGRNYGELVAELVHQAWGPRPSTGGPVMA